MANTLLKLGGVAVAIGGAYLYMKNKGKKEQEQILATLPATTQPAVSTTTESGTYTKDEAKKLAMSVIEKTIKLYDEIPKDRLADKHRSVIQQEEFKAKQEEYKKAKALAKSKNQKSFTYLGETYNTLDGKPVNSGSGSWFSNPYEGIGLVRETMSFGGSFFPPKTLGDQANKFKKSQGWVESYDLLVNAFSKMPKSQVDSLLPIVPKMLFTAQPYAYLQEYLEKNPYNLQDTLIIRESNLEEYNPRRDVVLGTKLRELQSASGGQVITATQITR
jgi:hypothetical protein